MITAAVERRNGFYRWNSKSGKKQLLAANVDIVLLVTSAEHPPFRPRFIDRALVQCDAAGLLPWIVCNKCDLTADAQFAKRVAIWASLGITVLRLSAVTGEGVKELHTRLIRYNLRHAATVAVLVGQSGVGKSSLVNALIGNGGDAHLSRREGALCTKYDRGAHTTAVGTLIRLPYSDGRKCIGLVDTPGVRRFELHDIAAEDLALHFAEMSPYVGKCRYGMSCTHESEDGCAIRAAVERGEISAERYDSFRRIKIDIQAVRQDEGG